MKLYCSLTSPYARKVRVAIGELGIADRVEQVVLDPWDSPPELLALNPLGKIPALLADDGLMLPDSRLILDYLAANFPGLAAATDPSSRWRTACRRQLADGLMDAVVAMVVETKKRPEQYRWEGWLERQTATIHRTLDALAKEADALTGDAVPGLAEITLGCALSFLDARFPRLDWRLDHAVLGQWFRGFAQRPSMLDTQPPG